MRFLKDTINSWSLTQPVGGLKWYAPAGGVWRAGCFTWNNGTAVPGVYQALSGHDGGEVISADAD